ncbi:MAG: 4Fe-4S binding protein [Chloroflexi bacterium]|nr:4Fe-4S binding protein [Chloroflexota bacterium]
MPKFYDALKIEYGKCPPGCALCEEACVRAKGGDGAISRIRAVHAPSVSFHGAITCNQCSQPACVEICPTRAIVKSYDDGVVRVNQEKCVGCGLCTLGCPYGGIYYNPEAKQSSKCDMCDGDPQCVKACPYGVLKFINYPEALRGHLITEDLFTSGVGLCSGCPIETVSRITGRVLGENVVFFGTPGCCSRITQGVNAKASARVPCYFALMTNAASTAAGAKRYYQKTGQDIMTVAMVGDGATADVGFAGLSGAAERGENIIYICFDNEAYMATGIQKSGTTPLSAWTFTSPVGKHRAGRTNAPKYMPLIMADHGIPYTATATVSHPLDYAQKLEKAKQVKDGLVYIHVFSPCYTGWRAAEDSSVEISRMAVETNYFPLWECERGEFRFTYLPKRPLPVQEFTQLMGRFRHLKEADVAGFQKLVDDRFRLLESLTKLKTGV